MLVPDYIITQNFSNVGKNGYLSSEVNSFCQRVHESYSKLYDDHKKLISQRDSMKRTVAEYNKNKGIIADAVLSAQLTSKVKIEEAQQQADILVADAKVNAENLFNARKAEADNYYSSKIAAADEKVEKAETLVFNLKNQADDFSKEYIDEVNLKAQKIIDDAKAKAALLIAGANKEVDDAREKAEKILADANTELNTLKAESAKIKNEILSLISFAQKAAEEVDNRIFEPIISEQVEELVAEPVEAEADEELEPFTIRLSDFESDAAAEAMKQENEEEEEEPGISLTDSYSGQPEFISDFDKKAPNVNNMFSDIFASLEANKAKAASSEEDDGYRFNDIFADPADRSATRKFNPVKDGE